MLFRSVANRSPAAVRLRRLEKEIVISDDGTMADDNLVKLFFERVAEALGRTGKPEQIYGEDLRARLAEAGFDDIEVRKFKLPLAPWPKEPRLKQAGALVSRRARAPPAPADARRRSSRPRPGSTRSAWRCSRTCWA